MTAVDKQVGVAVQLYVGYHYNFYVFKDICWRGWNSWNAVHESGTCFFCALFKNIEITLYEIKILAIVLLGC